VRDVTANDSPRTLYEYAIENHRMANDLYDLIFPPWRWLKWWRAYREVMRRVRVLKEARGDV
jgi:hypothetical protein